MNNTIMLLVGLPGSGKSTWTNQFLRNERRFQVVCRDDLRATFGVDGHCTVSFDPGIEQTVADIANRMLEASLRRGLGVILDETHTRLRNINEVLDTAKKHRASVHVVYFPFTAEESKARRPGVPPEVIDRMARNLRTTVPCLEYYADMGFVASLTRSD